MIKVRNNETNVINTFAVNDSTLSKVPVTRFSNTVTQTSPEQEIVTTVYNILPTPKSEYSVTYERIQLKNEFLLSKLPQDTILDVWRTHPAMPSANVAAVSNVIQIHGTSHLRELDEELKTLS